MTDEPLNQDQHSDFNNFMEHRFGMGWRLEHHTTRIVTRREYLEACSEWSRQFRRRLEPLKDTARLRNSAQRRLANPAVIEEMRITVSQANRGYWYGTHGFVVSGQRTIAMCESSKPGFNGWDYDLTSGGRGNTRFIATFQPFQVAAMLDEIERLRQLLEENGIDPGKAPKFEEPTA